VTRDAEAVRRADKIVVPGQGAFGVFMRGLVESVDRPIIAVFSPLLPPDPQTYFGPGVVNP